MADLHELRPKEVLEAFEKTNESIAISENSGPSTFESLTSGAFGGVSLVIVGHPLDLLKVRLQTASVLKTDPSASLNMGKLFSSLMKRQGLAGLYRGVTAPLLGVAPIFAVNIWGFDAGKSMASRLFSLPENDLYAVAFGGAFSALPTSALQVPGDRIKLRLQVSDSQRHANPFQATRDIWKHGKRDISNNWLGGFRSLYRGYWVTLAREVPGSAIYFSNYYYLKTYLTDRLGKSQSAASIAILLSGGIAGTLNGLLTLPIDTVKSRFQASQPAEFSSSRQVLQKLLKTEGPSALFKGLGPVLLRAFPANAACFGGIEAIRFIFTNGQMKCTL
jgi:solute carrier family 25 (mitochondrial carnitine/acylcarnitine transporter), member 20/29